MAAQRELARIRHMKNKSKDMVIQEDILVGAVLHKKSVWDHSYLHKAKTFI